MDWLLDPRDREGATATSSLVADHLQRHAREDADLAAATEEVDSLLRGESADAEDPLWVHLDWTALQPVLVVHRLSPAAGEALENAGLALDEPLSPGHQELLTSLTRSTGEPTRLPLERASLHERDLDSSVLTGVDVDAERDGLAAVPTALVAAAEAYPGASASQLATLAGSRLADSAAGSRSLGAAEHVADAFVKTHQAMGSDPQVVTATDDRLELVIGRCPFKDAAPGARSVCGLSVAMAGRLGARLHGKATVVLEESIAMGDRSCRMQVLLGEAAPEVEGHTFTWPGSPSEPDTRSAPHMELSVTLPRESSSVPVVRRLAGQALRAFGVTDDHVDDVQLAISEACGNVIDHAVETDTYEVRIELAADRCAITVVDQGHGFDSTRVAQRPDDDEEAGRGLALMRALVDNVAFEEQPQAGAVVHMVKALEYDHTHPLHVNRIG